MKVHEAATLTRETHVRALDAVRVSVTHHGPRFFAERHAHEHATLTIVLAGAYAERTRGELKVHQPFDLVFKPAGEAHQNEFRGVAGRCLLIEVHTAKSPSGVRPVPTPEGILEQSAVAVMGPVSRVLDELHAADDGVNDLALESAVVELLGTIERDRPMAGSTPEWVGRVAGYLRDSDNPRPCLAELAAVSDRNPSYLSRAFRHYTGRTLSRYVRDIRLHRACRALAMTEAQIGAIALSAGYCDQAHMGNAFRRQLGLTPQAFRSCCLGSTGRLDVDRRGV